MDSQKRDSQNFMGHKTRSKCENENVFHNGRNYTRRSQFETGIRNTKMGNQDKISDLSQIWNTFVMDTSCHGVKSITSSTKSKTIRTLYGIAVIITLLGLLMTVVSLLNRVCMYNTVTRSEIYIDPNMTFPTVTLCNICPYSFRNKNESDPLYRLLASDSLVGGIMPELDIEEPLFKNFLQRPTEDISKEYPMSLDILHAEYDGKKIGMEYFEWTIAVNGPCYQFNGHAYVAKHGPWLFSSSGRRSGLRVLVSIQQDDYGIFEDITAGLRVYISHIKDSPHLNTRGIEIMPGTSSSISMKPHKISFLPRPYKSFGSEYCIDGDVDSPELVAKMVNATLYSFEKCREQCVDYQTSLMCSCYNPLFVVPGLRPCTVHEYLYGCYKQTSARLKTNMSIHCDCPRLCTFMQYDVTLSASQMPSKVSRKASLKYFNETDIQKIKNISLAVHVLCSTGEGSRCHFKDGENYADNYLEVRVYFDSPLMWVQQHDPEYSYQNFVSSLGGQMGICLGASLLTLVEFWELILRLLVVGVRRLAAKCSAPKEATTEK